MRQSRIVHVFARYPRVYAAGMKLSLFANASVFCNKSRRAYNVIIVTLRHVIFKWS